MDNIANTTPPTMKHSAWFAWALFLSLSLPTFAQAQQEAVFYIESLNAQGAVIRSGTGFFTNNSGTGLTHRDLFIDAASANAIMADSSVYPIERITGDDPASGLVRFQITGLTGDSKSIALGSTAAAEGSQAQLLSASGNSQVASVGSTDISISLSQAQAPYGQLMITGYNANRTDMGSPVLANNQLVGVLVPGVISGQSFIVDAQRIKAMGGKNLGLAPYASSVRSNHAYLNAMLNYHQGNWDLTAASFAAVKRDFPNDAVLFKMSAESQMESGNPAGALEDWTEVIRLDGNNVEAYTERGFIYYDQNKGSEALQDFNRAVALKGTGAKLFEYRGRLLYKAEDYASAEADLVKAIEAGIEDAEVEYLLGNARFRLKKYPEAISAYDAAISKGLENELVYNNRGKAKFLTEDVSGAIADYSASLNQKGDYDRAMINRADAYALQEDWANAAADYRSARQMGVVDGAMTRKEGDAYLRLEDWANAVQAYDAAQQTGLQEAAMVRDRGFAHFQLESYAKAATDLNTAAGSFAEEVKVFRELGLAQFELSKYNETVAALTQATKLGATDKDEMYA